MAGVGGGGVKIKRPSWWKQEYESLNSRRAMGLGSGGSGYSSIGGAVTKKNIPTGVTTTSEPFVGPFTMQQTNNNGIRNVTQRGLYQGSIGENVPNGMATRWDPIRKRFIIVKSQPGMSYAL